MDVKNYLKKLNISFKEFNHPSVYTCEEAEEYNKNIRGIHSKNLFIKDRKSKKFYLVILPADKQLKLEDLEKILGVKLKFANKEDLKKTLNLESGAVSPFGLINDNLAQVQLILDKDISTSDYVSFHPNINTQTFEISKEDFNKYLNSLKNEVKII